MCIVTFLRKNIVMAAGIALPLVVVAFFLAAQMVPRLFVDPPQHDFVFVSTDYDYQRKPPINVHVGISKGRLQATVHQAENHSRIPKIFLFDHELEDIREIHITLPDDLADIEDGREIPIEELAHLKFNTSRRAPDGYQFRHENSSGGGLVAELFFNNRRNRYAIVKDGAVVPIPSGEGRSYYGVNFLGWIVD